ncbi:uncharacterized protein NPIL_412791 [Nephila pilipes]|uniref:DNA-directed DNA polymerase n=1 Tax=Nephila pilipes TaxID=299642 RepID=A0A8X6TB98_NEPPI|nr:uncharacterized protein NPIL_412791 [Nephila pilipes]
MNYFELDPVHFYTIPSLTWSAEIKTTNVTLELLTDIDMYLMLESGIRGGMCLVSKRFSKANNKYLENFDEMSPSKYIISLDVNNLYGTAMAFYNLPESEFRFLDQNEIQEFDLMSVRSDSNVGYILEVDLYYPPELHSEHNSFPMAPHHEAITFDMLSPYQKEIYTDSLCLEVLTDDFYNDLVKKIKNLMDFSNYDASHKYHSTKHQSLLGYLKDETKGVPIKEFCALRPKMYSYTFGKENKKTAKGTKKSVVQNVLKHEMYLNVFKNDHLIKNKKSSIISKNHTVSTIQQNKTSLCSFYDKMYLCDEIECLAYGNVSIRK